jgi:four helix bundle protein
VGLVKDIYSLTGGFPKSKTMGLVSQIRRAAVSIPSNIAEGQARNGTREFSRFLSISIGSIAELETQLIISREIGYLSSKKMRIFCL